MQGKILASFEDVRDVLESAGEPKDYRDSAGRVYATGRRKSSVARVWISPGAGSVSINGLSLDRYFPSETLRGAIFFPFEKAGRLSQYNVFCTVKGGGLSGQAGAIRHGISRALCRFECELRGDLKKSGLLTRDSRCVERKKPGRKKARRSFQFSKR